MSETLYRVEEAVTTGWELVNEDAVQLTREKAKELLDSLLAEGYNPNRLRAVPDV
jgi:hypothetical protein